jgi:hypothetical protein
MLFDPAGDEEPEGNKGVFLEKFEHVVNEILHILTVFAFVETVDNDKERSFDNGSPEQAVRVPGSCLEGLIHQVAKLGH